MTRTLRATTAVRPAADGRKAIAVVLRWEDTGESRTIARRLRCPDATAAYRVLLLALWEARRMRARAIVLSTENADVAAQLAGTATPPPETLGPYLQVRALLNGFRSARAGWVPAHAPDAAAASDAAATAGAPRPAIYTDLPLWTAAAS